MSVGRIRNGDMNRVGKQELLLRLKATKGNGIMVRDLIRGMVNNPEDENQRPRVWSITQGLAELQRERFVRLTSIFNWKGEEGILASAV